MPFHPGVDLALQRDRLGWNLKPDLRSRLAALEAEFGVRVQVCGELSEEDGGLLLKAVKEAIAMLEEG